MSQKVTRSSRVKVGKVYFARISIFPLLFGSLEFLLLTVYIVKSAFDNNWAACGDTPLTKSSKPAMASTPHSPTGNSNKTEFSTGIKKKNSGTDDYSHVITKPLNSLEWKQCNNQVT